MDYALAVKKGRVHQRFPINLPADRRIRVASNYILTPALTQWETAWYLVWRGNPPGSVVAEPLPDNASANRWAACVCAYGYPIELAGDACT